MSDHANMDNFIRTAYRDQILEIILNRPEKRNAINWSMMLSLEKAVEHAEREADARVVLLRGEGLGFSSGVDYFSMSDLAEIFGENWRDNMMSVTASYQQILNRFERCRLPTIALLHGFSFGLGFELAIACDFRIATEDTKLRLPEVQLGLVPDVGGTTRLTNLVGPARAKEIIITGRVLDSNQAYNWGLLNAVVPQDELYNQGKELAQEIINSAPLAVSYTKRIINDMSDIDRGLQLEALAQNHLIQSEDFMTGLQALLSKTNPKWRGK